MEETFSKPRRRWEENITMDFTETGINTRYWVHLDTDYLKAFLKAALNIWVPQTMGLVIPKIS